MLLRATPNTVLKMPPIIILPSGWTAMVLTLTAGDAEIERLVEPAVDFQPGDAIASHRRSAVRRERDESAAR